ncbi:hypothetical protein F4604DRAFT_1880502 [Suillus subluteus]|nr:hypothetical protein F4604DRAFT_1880502 [Suillus subluteus]
MYIGNDGWEDVEGGLEVPASGGELEDNKRALLESAVLSSDPQWMNWKMREHHQRLEMMHQYWHQQLPALTIPEHPPANTAHLPSIQCDCEYIPVFTVDQANNEYANVALLRHGLLGCSPVTPSIAIDIQTLELYHRLWHCHPQLGVQPFVKTLCDLHEVNYHTGLHDQFSIAFDIYLDILRVVKKEIDSVLGCDSLNWRVLNACPCCHYKLEGEEPLIPAVLYAADGNNSARRAGSAGAADQCEFSSNYIISQNTVNVFKDEVKHSRGTLPWPPVPNRSHIDADTETTISTDDMLGRCTSNFKVSGPEQKKTALDIYEITGIFAAACHHGIIEKICEMVRSGELAKYGLAIIDHLLQAHGNDIGLAQDTGCAFSKTICVNAFHGYAHSHLCQLRYHPLYRTGFRLSDLEVMERVFSMSNALARVIRYATRYHWRQAIDLHFQQWDEDRYQDLSKFLYSKYKQALAIIHDFSDEVKLMCDRLSIAESDIQSWLDAEQRFLMNLKDEPVERQLKAAYVRTLQQQFANYIHNLKWQKVLQAFMHSTSVNTVADARQTLRLETVQRTAMDELLLSIRSVSDYEEKLGISATWSTDHLEYRAAEAYMHTQDFHRALDKLQQLVVQRLFELSKANMAGTGRVVLLSYKLRTAIGKAIKTRSQAIRTALNKYNILARQLSPPAPVIQWNDIIHYGFISEFELLKHSYSQHDIHDEPWTIPANRDVASKYFKIQCAHEEITCLNVEIRHLHTAIVDENTDLAQRVSALCETDSILANAADTFLRTRLRVNAMHLRRLCAIEALPGFSGITGTGV